MTKKIILAKSVKKNKIAQCLPGSFGFTTPAEQEFSLSKAVEKIAYEINRILDHGYSREDVTAILSNSNIKTTAKTRGSNNISNIAIELLPKPETSNETPHFHTMASYNDSNRVAGHETRWNSR